MSKYKSVIILHAVDNSTLFLNKFSEAFCDYYHSFNSKEESINKAKTLIGDLEPKSLIIFLGHGGTSGLYEPDNTFTYEKYFLNTKWANHYFDEHDVFLLTCRSNDFIKKIYTSNFLLGFGNIISSKTELDIHNNNNKIKKKLNEIEIDLFNDIYLKSIIKVIKLLINDKIRFKDTPKHLRFYLNKNINEILLDKKNSNRLELARILFEFRNQIQIKQNIK